MKQMLAASMIVVLLGAGFGAVAGEKKKSKNDVKREKIDGFTKEALATLVEDNKEAKKLFDRAYGFAVFSNVKISLFISAGGGTGVAVAKKTKDKPEKRTYMRMGTVGLNIGLGGQKYQVIFFFENKGAMNRFVEKGWQADAQANAVAGTAGANAEATFSNGMAIYQITKAGLMLQADIAGTKYWKDKKLNK